MNNFSKYFFRKLDENCDFGALSQLIIRPNEVFFFNKRDSLKKDEPLLKPDNKPTVMKIN